MATSERARRLRAAFWISAPLLLGAVLCWAFGVHFTWTMALLAAVYVALTVYASRAADRARAAESGTGGRAVASRLGAASAAALMLANVAANLVATQLDQDRPPALPDADELFRNHDLTRLSGYAVGVVLERAAESGGLERAGEFARLAVAATDWWDAQVERDLALEEQRGALRDRRTALRSQLAGRARTQAEGVRIDELSAQLAALDAASAPLQLERPLGGALLDLLEGRSDGGIGVGVWRAFVDRACTHAGLQMPTETRAVAAHELFERFPVALREALKEDAARGGKAFASLQLEFLGRIAERAAAVRAAQDDAAASDADLARLLVARVDGVRAQAAAASADERARLDTLALAVAALAPPPCLEILHERADVGTPSEVGDAYAQVEAGARLRLHAAQAGGGVPYVLCIDGHGAATLHGAEEFLTDASGGWWLWDVGAGPTETLLLLCVQTPLDANVRAALTADLAALGPPPPLAASRQLRWRAGTAVLLEGGRGAPARSRGVDGWSDRVAARLVAMPGLRFDGRTLHVAPRDGAPVGR